MPEQIRIDMHYFAIVREITGKKSESLELPEGATVDMLLDDLITRYPRLTGARKSMMVMVNQEYVESEHLLTTGDEVALIPPVSGGAAKRFVVTASPLDHRLIEAMVADPGAGAIITFVGVVRDNAVGQTVTHLEYEAYPPAAEKMLARIGDEMAAQWPLTGIAIAHRTGSLSVGETSVVIAVSSAHRDAAYEASRYAIERIKQIVPIWKKEHYADGATWIGSESDYQSAFRQQT